MRLTRDLDTNSMEIHEAAESGDVAAISQAIQRGLDPNSPDACNSDRTPLHLACSNKNLEAVKVLIAANADPAIGMKGGWTAAHSAAEAGATPCLRHLVKAQRSICMIPDDANDRPIDIAALYAHQDTVEYLEALDEEAARFAAPPPGRSRIHSNGS